MAQQTAVEWLFEQICNLDWNHLQGEKKLEIFEQAKQMEKEQIMKAYKDHHNLGHIYGLDLEQYYNETYGK